MLAMIEHYANNGDYLALLFIAACGVRVVVLVWHLVKGGA